jgi:phage-related protein
MTVIGEAYIRIKGVTEADMGKSLTGVENQIEGVGTSAEKSSGRAKAAFKQMGGALAGAFGPAFGPIGEIIDKFGEIDKVAGGLKKNIGVYALGIGGAMTAAGTMITTWSDKDKTSTRQLQTAVQNAGGSWDKYKDQTEEAIKHQEGFGHTAVETQDALTDLVTRTHDIHQSYENMNLVADIAAQKHTSLASAASIVSRVMNGQTRTLKLYGISQDSLNAAMDKGVYHQKNMAMTEALNKQQTDKNAIAALALRDAQIRNRIATTGNKDEQAKLTKILHDDALKHAELSASMKQNSDKASTLKTDLANMAKGAQGGAAGIELLKEKLKGQAAIAADTFSGKMAAIKARIEDFVGVVGQKVGPVLQATGPALMGFGAIVESGVVGKMGKGVKMLATWNSESKIVQAATKVWTGVQWALDAAMDAFGGPMILIVAGIAALAAGVVLAYMKFKPFHDLVNAVARDLKKWFLDAFDAVKKAFTDFVHGFEVVWQTVVGIVKKYGLIILAVIAPVIGIPLLIITHWKTIVAFFTKLPGEIVNAVGNVGRTIWSAISAGITWIKGKFKDAVDLWVDIYIKFPLRVLRAIGNLGMQIWNNITDGLATMKSKVMDFIGGVVTFFAGFPAKVMRAIGNLGSQIWGGIQSGLAAMKDHVTTWVGNVAGWFAGLPGKAVRAIGNLGGAIWNGISSGLSTIKTKIGNALSGVKTAVTNAFTGAAQWLVSAGGQIIGGLVSGILSSVESKLKSAVGGIGNFIKSHKGPEDYDRRLLTPHGHWIMEGLIKGIEGHLPNLHATLRGVGDSIKLPMHPNAAGAVGMAGGGFGATRVINLFPDAHIDFGHEDPAFIVQRLETALRASRF